MKPDIGPILEQWPYEPGQIAVRKIRCADGKEKLQLRLDLGLLQMELAGRPDGKRPYGFASVLEYVEGQLASHSRRRGGDEGFTISERMTRELQDEALMNYHRYLSLYVLEDFDGVARDTASNLRIFDLIRQYAPSAAERHSLEQYRPYVTMMNTRARAQQSIGQGDYPAAMAIVNSGLAAIRSFFESYGRRQMFGRSGEVAVLRELRKDISKHLPKDPLRQLKRQLRRAVQDEQYEEAARLRDRIEQLQAEGQPRPSENADRG